MILNLTQHSATAQQKQDGVVEPKEDKKVSIKKLLTFNSIPDRIEIIQRAESLASLAKLEGVEKALIGGAPYLMSALEEALRNAGVTPVYSFTKRKGVETPVGNGAVKKVQIFTHVGFINNQQVKKNCCDGCESNHQRKYPEDSPDECWRENERCSQFSCDHEMLEDINYNDTVQTVCIRCGHVCC